jgi:hypothetical protein
MLILQQCTDCGAEFATQEIQRLWRYRKTATCCTDCIAQSFEAYAESEGINQAEKEKWYGYAAEMRTCGRVTMQRYVAQCATLQARTQREVRHSEITHLRKRMTRALGPERGAGVYIVQLLTRTACFKIGQSIHICARLEALRQEYGALVCVLAIPHDQPRLLEAQLHKRLAAYRIYEGAGPSELFQFDTRAKRKVFERFLRQFGTYQQEEVCWDAPNKKRPDEQEPTLFSSGPRPRPE